MTCRVIGVKHFKVKGCFSIIFTDGREYDTEKMKTYGLLPVEKFSRDLSLLNSAISAVGKDCDLTFDYSGNVTGIKLH